MSSTKLGSLDNHRQQPWKAPLPEFIEHLYEKRFGRERPAVVRSIEQIAEGQAAKKESKRAKKQARRANEAAETAAPEASPSATLTPASKDGGARLDERAARPDERAARPEEDGCDPLEAERAFKPVAPRDER